MADHDTDAVVSWAMVNIFVYIGTLGLRATVQTIQTIFTLVTLK